MRGFDMMNATYIAVSTGSAWLKLLARGWSHGLVARNL